MKNVVYLLALPLALYGENGKGIASNHEVARLLLESKVKERSGDLFGACALLERGLARYPGEAKLRRELFALNKKLYLTDVKPTGTLYYRVVPRDNLTKIAAKHRITVRHLRRLNGLKKDNLGVGQKLKIVKGPFDLSIKKQRFTLEVRSRGKVLFTYPVGLGKDNSTPTGAYVAGPRLVKPTQFDRETGKAYKFGHPDHTIGTRWITFSGQYGIHGTVDPKSIGKEMSHGCVRLRNKDVEEVFDLVVTGKSKVIIEE